MVQYLSGIWFYSQFEHAAERFDYNYTGALGYMVF